MKITANDLKKLKIIDKIISEPETGAQDDFNTIVEELKKYLIQNIKKLQQLSEEELVKQRYEKFMSY